MDDWKLPWEGGCRCDRVRFRVVAPPILASACHFTGCQRMSASAFSLTLTIPSDGFATTEGDPVVGGLRGATQHFFCAHCMSWMFTRPENIDAFVNLRASMLDECRWFVPFAEFWTDERLPWARTPAVHSFETQPDFQVYSGLIEGFAQQGSRPA